jgi:chromosome partitioning protein
MRTLATVRDRYGHPDLRVTMVVPTFYRRTKLAHDILEQLKQRFPKEIAHGVIGYHVRIDEAQSKGLSVFEYAPRDRGAQLLAELAEELDLRAPVPIGEMR